MYFIYVSIYNRRGNHFKTASRNHIRNSYKTKQPNTLGPLTSHTSIAEYTN